MSDVANMREKVQERYGAIAEGKRPDCCTPQGVDLGCCTGEGAQEAMLQVGYSPEQATAVPEGANLGLGCGNPIAHAALKPGETVLDLGSGAGVDCFLAGREVGPKGRAIGVDMTPQMLSRARATAAKGGYANVEFRLGEIEHLPVADASVDCIISNCVINLSTDKPRVFREAYRVLKPGGRLVVSDLAWLRPMPQELRDSVDAYVGCIAGASLKEDYLRLIRDAGLVDVEVLEESRYAPGEGALAGFPALQQAYDAVASIKVRAWKR